MVGYQLRISRPSPAPGQIWRDRLTSASAREPPDRYALERLLYRLSISSYRDRFVLKGAMLLTTWFDDPHRATRDVDLLGYGDPSAEPMLAAFREIANIAADDGLTSP